MASNFIRYEQYTPRRKRIQCQIEATACLSAEPDFGNIVTVFRVTAILFYAFCLLCVACQHADRQNRELLRAVQGVDEKATLQALTKGADPNATFRGNETALGHLLLPYKRSHEERRRRIERLATHLLKLGANPDASHHGFTPLQIAAGQESEVLVTQLLAHGANPNLTARHAYPPLWQAVFDNNARIGHLLLQAGANPNAPGPGGLRPLSYLRLRGQQKSRLIRILCRYGAL